MNLCLCGCGKSVRGRWAHGHNRALDLTNKRSGRLLILRRAGTTADGHVIWTCRCDCGRETSINAGNLARGQKSCGCIIRTHNLSRSQTYKSWQMMRMRCENPNNTNYPRYGGNGIRVCERWHRFEEFLSDMGERPGGTSLDRIDSKGDYEPTNCRWATRREQNINTTRWAGYRTLDGERISIRAMAEYLAISQTALHYHLRLAR